jgi:FtsZ-binding cell division protein ZapB
VKRRTLQKIKDLAHQATLLLAEVENLRDADSIKDEVSDIRDAERDVLDSMSEKVVDGEKGEAQANAVEKLDEAYGKLEDIATKIVEIKDDLQEAIELLEAVE